MIIQPDGNSGNFIEIVNGGWNYLGAMDLTQYFIRETGSMKEDNGSIKFNVILGRRLLGMKEYTTLNFQKLFFKEQFLQFIYQLFFLFLFLTQQHFINLFSLKLE